MLISAHHHLFYAYVILHVQTCKQNHFTCMKMSAHKYQILSFSSTVWEDLCLYGLLMTVIPFFQ